MVNLLDTNGAELRPVLVFSKLTYRIESFPLEFFRIDYSSRKSAFTYYRLLVRYDLRLRVGGDSAIFSVTNTSVVQ